MTQYKNKLAWPLYVVLTILFSFFSPLLAQESPSKFIELLYGDVLAVNESHTTNSEKLQHITELLEKNIDFNKLARFVLGKNFNTLSPEDFQIFSEHYKKSTSQKYAKLMIVKFQRFKILKEESLGKNKYLVHTILEKEKRGDSAPLKITYLAVLENESYKILDVIVSENISMAMADREEVVQFLESKTIKDLLESYT